MNDRWWDRPWVFGIIMLLGALGVSCIIVKCGAHMSDYSCVREHTEVQMQIINTTDGNLMTLPLYVTVCDGWVRTSPADP